MEKIRVIGTLYGDEAPESVRRGWIGVVLPLAKPEELALLIPGYYFVNAKDALMALEEASRKFQTIQGQRAKVTLEWFKGWLAQNENITQFKIPAINCVREGDSEGC